MGVRRWDAQASLLDDVVLESRPGLLRTLPVTPAFSHMRGLDGVLHQLAGVLERKFFLEMTLVRFDGLDAEVKFFGDLARCVAFTDQVKHFELPIR